jgi:hypothetical protein
MEERNDSRMQIHEALRSYVPALAHTRAHAIVSERTRAHARVHTSEHLTCAKRDHGLEAFQHN